MDFLKSLVGKDQETITEAIKEMAENTEKVRIEEKEIVNLQNELDDAKEQVHYLKNKLNQKYDLIDDMEREIDIIEDKYKDAKKEVEMKDRELNELGKFISEQAEEITVLRDNILSMVQQISENVRMEAKIDIQQRVIKDLKEKQTNADQTKEVEKLVLEVDQLNEEILEKLDLLTNIGSENKILKEELKFLEIENLELNDRAKNNVPLSEELHHPRKIKCENCELEFETRSILKEHIRTFHEMLAWNAKLAELETEISGLKYGISTKLLKLQELELNKRDSCSCRGFCAISHLKHNWTKSFCNEIFVQMENLSGGSGAVNIHQCKTCEQKFPSPEDFIHHMQTNHKTADVDFLQN